MHVFMMGAGGVGIGPLSLIAKDAGMKVHGSDRSNGPMVEDLNNHGIEVWVPHSANKLKELHSSDPIDWIVYSSSIPDDNEELTVARKLGIKTTKRDAFINEILHQKKLDLVAIAGTHGKTTTTAMVVWLMEKTGNPVSYSIGAQLVNKPSGHFERTSRFFVYECDEFDRNFLNFSPLISLITNIDYDHPDTYSDPNSYHQAFGQFARQCDWITCWEEDGKYLKNEDPKSLSVHDKHNKRIESIKLLGRHNRENAWLAISVVSKLTGHNTDDLINLMSDFPGTSRRFEKLSENIYTDYAHHPMEISATIKLAKELNKKVIVVYQPHQNVRQFALADEYQDCFKEAEMVYWVPTYLTRENLSLPELNPQQLIDKLTTKNAVVASLNNNLIKDLKNQLTNPDNLVIFMGAGSIDDWARKNFVHHES